MISPALEKIDTNAALRIVIADDHALVRGGLAMMIDMAASDSEVLQANSLDQATEHLSGESPVDLLLLDLMMPGMDGIEGIRTIRASWPAVPIVVVSVHEDINSIKGAISAGAMGYIPKSSTPSVTISALKLVLDGGIYVPPHVLNLANQSPQEYAAPESSPEGPLTRRQQEVMKLVEAGKSNNAIAEQLGLSTGTVKMHVSGIFKKLNAANRTEAVAIFSKLKGKSS